MKRLCIPSLLLCACFTFPLTASADDLDWSAKLGLSGNGNLDELKVALGTRFNIGDTKVAFLISNVDKPVDSYMVLRLSELSNRPVDDVLKVYKNSHGRGWGSIARHLGIKPGSAEFHEFKASHERMLAREPDDTIEIEVRGRTFEHPGHGRGHGRGRHEG